MIDGGNIFVGEGRGAVTGFPGHQCTWVLAVVGQECPTHTEGFWYPLGATGLRLVCD